MKNYLECRHRMKLAWTVALTLISLCHSAQAQYVRAVNYFGSAWPVNYWNSDLSSAEKDFEQIKADGFNAIIISVPWGEFQPGLNPVRFNENAFRLLDGICGKAKARNLNVFMRVSYLHDMYPGVEMPGSQRFDSLMAGDALMPAWKQYLKKIAATTKSCSSGAFISWEDYWHSIETLSAAGGGPHSMATARNFGLEKWLMENADEGFKKSNQEEFKRVGGYAVPARNTPEFKWVFAWFDDQFVRRLMPALKESISNATIEARVDSDPIYKNKEIDGWYSHERTYPVDSSKYLMTYWAPAMGAKNTGDKESARKVLDRFSYINKKISSATKNQIFIGQFLYQDSTPSAARNTVINPSEVGKFFAEVPSLLLSQTAGYALWGHRDYEASLLFNSGFELGALGWELTPGAKIVKGRSGNGIKLDKGSAIAQNIPSSRDHFVNSAKKVTLRLMVSGAGELAIDYAGASRIVKLPRQPEHVLEIEFPVAKGDSSLKISSNSNSVEIDSIYLFSYVQAGDFRDPQGNPGRLFEQVKGLNEALAKGSGMPSSLTADDDSLSVAAGVYAREKSDKDWYAWAGPQVSARVFTKSSSIAVKGFIKPSMFGRSEGCSISATVNGATVSKKDFREDGAIDMLIPVGQKEMNSVVDLGLKSNCSINPQKENRGKDQRDLSYMINKIDLSPPGVSSGVPLSR
jgi:hypothetical protein